MQQLFSAFGLDWRLLIIQMVNFGLLLSVLTYFLYRPIVKIIDERRAKIAAGIKAYEQAGRKLADAHTESAGIISSAVKESEQMVAGARMRALERGTEIVRAAEGKADATIKDGIERAVEERRKILAAGEKEIARMAILAAEKVLSKHTV